MTSLTFYIISFMFFPPRYSYLHANEIYLFWSPGFLKDQKHNVLVHISAEVKYTIQLNMQSV